MKCKSFFAVVAACLHQFVVFSLFLISNLSIVLISYLRGPEINTAITRELGYFLSPIASLTMSSFCSLGGFVEHKIGPRL